jgi:hypothetical protein
MKIALSEKQEKELREVCASVAHANSGRTAFADLFMEIVEPRQLTLDIVSAFMPVRNLMPGDEIGRKVRKGRYPVR